MTRLRPPLPLRGVGGASARQAGRPFGPAQGTRRATGGWRLRDTGLSAVLALLGLLVGAGPVAAQVEVVEYYATDAVGSVRVVFNASGQVVARADYQPFGELFAPVGELPPQQFTGQARDGEAGLDYFGARFYQPRHGRFTQVDPVYAGLFDPQQWNRYTYARANPLSFVDPDGRCSVHADPDKDSDVFVRCDAGGSDAEVTVGGSWAAGYIRLAVNFVTEVLLLGRDDRPRIEEVLQDLRDSGATNAEALRTALALCDAGATQPCFSEAGVPSLKGAAAKTGERIARLTRAAQSKYPAKAGQVEQHHVVPKYLGGARRGPTAAIDAAYHQEITNAFRAEWGYGRSMPSEAQLRDIMQRVYERFPLPGQLGRP